MPAPIMILKQSHRNAHSETQGVANPSGRGLTERKDAINTEYANIGSRRRVNASFFLEFFYAYNQISF
jgi:hypothetical protein